MAAVADRELERPNYLKSIASSVLRHRRGCMIYSQGDVADAAFYLLSGTVLVSIISPDGKEAVVEALGRGTFLGEDCILNSARRTCSAVTLDSCTLVRVEKPDLHGALRTNQEFSEAFLRHMLRRNQQMREDIAEQLFSSSERRLLRSLLVLAREAQHGDESGRIPRMSQSTLASMVGTTRSRISFFLGRFRKMGLIEYDQGIRINKVLITALLRHEVHLPEPEHCVELL